MGGTCGPLTIARVRQGAGRRQGPVVMHLGCGRSGIRKEGVLDHCYNITLAAPGPLQVLEHWVWIPWFWEDICRHLGIVACFELLWFCDHIQ